MPTGLVQIYTGNGKGKTTASLGLAVRARAAGKRVAIVFFDKGGEHYSERKLLERLGIDWFGYGLDRIDPKTERFRFGVIPDDVAQAAQGIAKAKELLGQRRGGVTSPPNGRPRRAAPTSYDLVILDEINTAVALGMVSEQTVGDLIAMRSPETEIVLTGRTEISKGAVSPPGKPWPDGNDRQRWLSYFDRADLVTEMRLVKHYFYRGVPAREGLDY
ncbi:cob(I)yrinic acid a,c-diamide adenosyltransferase [Candidatus Uhrbacteria bacterium]|nr:cob(I)yrinic acid a,c-diamide adenosyltransferase [Candidatus Uhrbacteria bacterium]